jgi:hypothetical protein
VGTARVALQELNAAKGPRTRSSPRDRCPDLERLGGLFDAQAAEDRQLDDLRLARIDLRQAVKRIIERDQVAGWRADHRDVVNRDLLELAAGRRGGRRRSGDRRYDVGAKK